MSIPISSGRLRDSAVDTEPMSASASSALLERLRFADGSVLIAKTFSPARDWMMRATHDTGRAAELWTSGVMDRLPPVIDPAIVRIERDGDGWRLYLRDVSQHFLRAGTVVSTAEVRRFLGAVAAMHDAFLGIDIPGANRLNDLLRLTSPATIAAEAESHAPFLAEVRQGWEAFDELAPSDVRDSIHAILEQPQRLAEALEARGTTLVHADLHYGNVAPAADRFYVLDWTLATAAPAAVDVAWYIDQSADFIEPTRDDVLEAFRAAEGPRHDPHALRLALLAELVLGGWQYEAARSAIDADRRAQRRAAFDWWVARARDGLETLA